MKKIDHEIHDLEQRMARRRHEVADSARLAKRRAVRKLVSPAGLATAAGLGFVLTFALLRRREAPVERRRAPQKQGKGAALVSLLMPAAVALIRAQFGSPAAMAQFVLSKVQSKPSPSGDARSAPARAPARTVHLAR